LNLLQARSFSHNNVFSVCPSQETITQRENNLFRYEFHKYGTNSGGTTLAGVAVFYSEIDLEKMIADIIKIKKAR